MAVGPSQQHVVAYRPAPALPALHLPVESAAITSDSNQLPFVHRHWLAHIATHAADPHLGSISRPFAVQEFCASTGAASPTPIPIPVPIKQTLDSSSDEDDDDVLVHAHGIIDPASCCDEPVAGIARLINVWNPKMTLKPSHFRESAADAPHCVLGHYNTEGFSLSTKLRASPVSEKRTMQFRVCSSCGERHTPQWRGGPFGNNTLCNVCGLLYAKRQTKREKSHSRKRSTRRRHR